MIQKFGDIFSPPTTIGFFKKILMQCIDGQLKTKCGFMLINAKFCPSIIFTIIFSRNSHFFLFPYEINYAILDYFEEEKDLGIIITSKFKFSNHRQEILSKALNQFNLLCRTCHFVKNSQKRRTLYLPLLGVSLNMDLRFGLLISVRLITLKIFKVMR